MGLPLSQPRPALFACHAAIGLCKLADFDTRLSGAEVGGATREGSPRVESGAETGLVGS